METTVWNIAFVILQTIFVFALGWFIRLLIIFNEEHKKLEKRVTELEKQQAVDSDRWRRWENWMQKIDNKIDKILEK